MNYTDNLKGFRRRCMIKKLELLMKQIEDVLEFAYEEGMYDRNCKISMNMAMGNCRKFLKENFNLENK